MGHSVSRAAQSPNRPVPLRPNGVSLRDSREQGCGVCSVPAEVYDMADQSTGASARSVPATAAAHKRVLTIQVNP